MADDDLAEMYRQIKKDKQTRHARWKEENTKYLEESGLKYKTANMGETVMFRTKELKADFYPSTGRWMDCRKPKKMMSGGARSFIGWLRARGVVI